MNKVQKPSSPECYTPSSERIRIYFYECFSVGIFFLLLYLVLEVAAPVQGPLLWHDVSLHSLRISPCCSLAKVHPLLHV
jgi:hypothetical protein